MWICKIQVSLFLLKFLIIYKSYIPFLADNVNSWKRSVWDTFCVSKTMTCDLQKKPAGKRDTFRYDDNIVSDCMCQEHLC